MPMPTSVARATNQPQNQPWVEIIEQPSSKATRFRYESENAQGGILNGAKSSKDTPTFRYECEGRSAGSILGKTSKPESKTYPAIKVHNHHGACVVVVSLVTAEDDKPKPHPHALVGGDCKSEVCTKKVKGSLDCIQFPNLGIQCKKKKELTASLTLRQQIRVDPFRTGFEHKEKPSVNDIDLTAVKLCFQVFLPDSSGRYQKALTPVVSDPIYDKKASSELTIVDMLPTSCSLAGGEHMILLTGKLPKDDFEVRFYEGPSQNPMWEGFASFTPKDIHQQVAVKVKIPQYRNPSNQRSKKQVNVTLRRKNKPEEASAPRKFIYLVDGAVNANKSRKRVSEDMETEQDIKHFKQDPNGPIDIGAAAFSNDNVPAVIDQVGYPSGSSFSSGSFHDANSFGSNGVQYANGALQMQQIHTMPHTSTSAPPITGNDAWIAIRPSDLQFIRNPSGTFTIMPGSTAQNQAAAPRDPADFGFSEEFMDQLIKNQKSDPESEIYIPSNFSDCLADFGIIVPNGDTAMATTSGQPESTSLTRALDSLPSGNSMANGEYAQQQQ